MYIRAQLNYCLNLPVSSDYVLSKICCVKTFVTIALLTFVSNGNVFTAELRFHRAIPHITVSVWPGVIQDYTNMQIERISVKRNPKALMNWIVENIKNWN